MTVFADASGWLSLLVPKDPAHEASRRYLLALRAGRALITTSDFVLDEVITRLRYDVGHSKAAEFMALTHEAQDAGRLRVYRITPDLWRKAEAIFLLYKDSRLSFTDCTSFALLRERSVDEVFGYDSHFEMVGHILRPKA
jgi:predicted nucleic acid-binding protein